MRISIDLPDALVDEVLRATQAATAEGAVVLALEDYLRWRQRCRVVAAAGTMDLDPHVRTLGEVDRSRGKPDPKQ